jgi:hypothetical protein
VEAAALAVVKAAAMSVVMYGALSALMRMFGALTVIDGCGSAGSCRWRRLEAVRLSRMYGALAVSYSRGWRRQGCQWSTAVVVLSVVGG